MVNLNALCMRTSVLLGLVVASSIPAPNAGADEQPASRFLEFQSEADGRCQVLSAGGKLRVLTNRHETRAIDYRLIRVFGEGHRQSQVAGTAPAGGQLVQLGCTQVDGRPQDWLLERAVFTP